MSNIGKLSIKVNKDIKDELTLLEGYKGEKLEIKTRKFRRENKQLNQIIISRKIQYASTNNLPIIEEEISATRTSNKVSREGVREIEVVNTKVLNIPFGQNQEFIIKNQENTLYNEIFILPRLAGLSGPHEVWEMKKGERKKMKKKWGTIRSSLKQIIDSLYITIEKNKEDDKEKEVNYLYKYSSELSVKGIGYRIEYDEKNHKLFLLIGYSNKIEIDVPLNIGIKTINTENILVYPKYRVLKKKKEGPENYRFTTANLNELTQFVNTIKEIKPSKKDKYKHQGLSVKTIKIK